MREAIGATWIFGIVIVFIIIFTGYLAFSVNYSKAFTLKDEIIDIIEKYNGMGTRSGNKTAKLIKEKMTEINYSAKGSCYNVANYLYNGDAASKDDYILGGLNETISVYSETSVSFPTSRYNYCIIREDETYKGGTLSQSNVSFSSYRVIVFFSVDIALLNLFSDYYVTGETKNITYPSDEYLHA